MLRFAVDENGAYYNTNVEATDTVNRAVVYQYLYMIRQEEYWVRLK